MNQSRESDISNRIIFFISFGFFLFYLVQIPFETPNSDVILYALRSGSDTLITENAHFDSRSAIKAPTLPNYHILHTAILWSVYRVMPDFLKETIWPAGLLSSVCGALAIFLTYLIWRRLGENASCALAISIVFGLIPSFWNQSIIGEVYTLQLLMILMFLWFFLIDRIFLSAIAFCAANLVSPISGLSFVLILLSGNPVQKLFIKAFICGCTALFLYFFCMYSLHIDVLQVFQGINSASVDRSTIWKIYKFMVIIFINLHFFICITITKYRTCWMNNQKRLLLLTAAILPQIFSCLHRSSVFN
jgi:hypothetical protein